MSNDYFFPQDWEPLTPPPARPPLTHAEKLAGRDALQAAQALKDDYRAALGVSRLPLMWDEALIILQGVLTSRTNDEIQEAMEWVQGLWHPDGTSLYEM